MFATKRNTYASSYCFQLFNDRQNKCILIAVYSLATNELLDASCGYTYADLEKTLKKKLKNLFYVTAETKTDTDGTELFYFHKADIYESPSFTKFLEMIDSGLIMFDIRIGSFHSGANYGKTHDHGSGFRILEGNLCQLYAVHESV